jgi:hypothetical protein
VLLLFNNFLFLFLIITNKMSDIEMHNTETLSVIPKWKGTVSIPFAMGEEAKGITNKLPAAVAKFWRGLDETLDEVKGIPN